MFASRKHLSFGTVRAAFVALLVFVLAGTGLSAELIQLKNGDYIQGSIVSQDQQRVVMKTDAGQRVISKATIRRIVYDKGMEQRLIAAKLADEEAQREAERRKREEELRRQKETELAALEAERKRKEEEERRLREERERIANERRARAARARYAYVVDEYNRRKAAYEKELAKKDQKEEKPVVQKDEDAKTEIDRWGPLWRSALVPGWGQMYAGQTGIGIAFTGAFALTAYNAYSARGIAVDAGNAYPVLPIPPSLRRCCPAPALRSPRTSTSRPIVSRARMKTASPVIRRASTSWAVSTSCNFSTPPCSAKKSAPPVCWKKPATTTAALS